MGNFIKTGGTASQFLMSDGTAYEKTFLPNNKNYFFYITNKSLTINSQTCYFTVKALALGEYVVAVQIYAYIHNGAFPGGKHGYATSTAALITESKYLPKLGGVNKYQAFVHTGQHLGGTSYMTSVVMDSSGYIWCYGVSSYKTSGETTTSQFYYDSTKQKFEAFYFVTPFKI
jgi:hypothetical protein